MMKIVSLSFIMFSVVVSAQQKGKKNRLPKIDSADVRSEDSIQNIKQKDLYKMSFLKPDASKYSSLKDKRKDPTDYKILNAMIPEKREDDK
ncbi:hypothetical protein [uncultured Chryseobacterium sp.]|uniref:hypothetical protein n=1 Tax=uncultured Chryseobacterium sp. TaxID=259322 RepID=UPI00374A1449